MTANAKMLKEVLDALKIDPVDLVGNDSGGGIAQIFAALNPERVRTLTLTNCPPKTTKRTVRAWRGKRYRAIVIIMQRGNGQVRRDADSPLEGHGFEPSVPCQR